MTANGNGEAMTPEELWRQYILKMNEAAKLVAEIKAEGDAGRFQAAVLFESEVSGSNFGSAFKYRLAVPPCSIPLVCVLMPLEFA
jgi:hypothetical protein